MDLLGVAAVVLDADGRITLWSPQVEDLVGYTADEALGRHAVPLLVDQQQRERVLEAIGELMETGRGWAGSCPVRHRDGTALAVELRCMRLMDGDGDAHALVLVTDSTRLRKLERDIALSTRLIAQAPIGLAFLDTDLRYLTVNPALERINGVAAQEHVGRRYREITTEERFAEVEAAMRQVLETGVPLVEASTVVGHSAADPEHERAWSISLYRLEDARNRVLGVAELVLDVSDRHWAAQETARARRRLALIADGSARIGISLDVEQVARELADVTVPELADVVTVDVLDSVLDELHGERAASSADSELFRALAVKTAHPTDAVRAVDPPGHIAAYGTDRLATQCARTGRPILIARTDAGDLARIARDGEAAAILMRAGIHSYLMTPLSARDHVIGTLGLMRAGNPLPFDQDDLAVASELASRAAVCIDNARGHQQVRAAAETLQRSLLPDEPGRAEGLELAYRYLPAQSTFEIGGDWYDVLPLDGGKTALVIGDVMGSGIDAAATMGRLRTATSAFADLDLDPAAILRHLDKITSGLERLATCVYAVYDPRRAECRIATAGHLPPALRRSGGTPELLGLPTGIPLGVGGGTFETTTLAMGPGDLLVLYTDGLVETRVHPIDERLNLLVRLLETPDDTLEKTCERLIRELRRPDDPDDVALLVARCTATGG